MFEIDGQKDIHPSIKEGGTRKEQSWGWVEGGKGAH